MEPETDTTPRPPSDARPADDPRPLFSRSVMTCTSVMRGITTDQFSAVTPCGMTTAELMEHLVMVLRRVAKAGEGADPMTWPIDAADVAVGGWADAWEQAATEVESAWSADSTLMRDTALPWGVFDGAEVLGVYANEITVHTWDLAVATGQRPDFDHEVLELSWTAIRQQLPMADRTPMWEGAKAGLPDDYPWEDPFGPAVDVADDAPLLDRLVGWNGRAPRSSAG